VITYITESKKLDPKLASSRNLPILENIINYSNHILKSESTNVSTIIAHDGIYHEGKKQYIIENYYTLNASNYTAYELLWLHVMIASGHVAVKGKLAFADTAVYSGERYLLLHLIHSQLRFYHQEPTYTKECDAVVTRGTFTYFFIANKKNISLALNFVLTCAALAAISLLSLTIIPEIAITVAAFIVIDLAIKALLYFVISSVLLPNLTYFNNERSLAWCCATDNLTSTNMQHVFEAKQI
jgi:hypothetical protein